MTLKNKEWAAIDDAFDPSLTTSYYLSIRIAADGLSFCVLDPVRNQFVLFRHNDFVWDWTDWETLAVALENIELFKFEYQKVVVVVDNRYSVLVPGMIFRPESATDILKFSFHDDLSTFVALDNRIKLADAVNVFAVPAKLMAVFGHIFPNVTYLHATTPLLEANMIVEPSQMGSALVRLHFEKDRFYVMVIERRNLKLFNCFDIKSQQDMLYYLLFVVEQCQLSAKELEVALSGRIAIDDEYHKLLKGYFKRVRFEKNDRHLGFAQALREIDLSRHFQLFNFGICV
jgi:hypothetical protein